MDWGALDWAAIELSPSRTRVWRLQVELQTRQERLGETIAGRSQPARSVKGTFNRKLGEERAQRRICIKNHDG